jgi:hypothetical protein
VTFADYVLDNNGDACRLQIEVQHLWNKLTGVADIFPGTGQRTLQTTEEVVHFSII